MFLTDALRRISKVKFQWSAIGLVALLLSGCGPVYIPMNQAQPFSPTLERFLDEQWIDRKSVHDWLGTPAAIRQQGQLEIYVAQLEVAHDILPLSDAANIYDYHYLFIEYDDSNRVQHHEVIINAGCSLNGICLFDRRCLTETGCAAGIAEIYRQAGIIRGSAKELLQVKIDHLFFYDSPEHDKRAKQYQSDGSGDCNFYLERGNESPGVKVTLPESKPLQLPRDGFLNWKHRPGQHRVQFEWSDWQYRYESRSLNLSCTAGETGYYRLIFTKIKTLGWRYDLSLEKISVPIGRKNITEKWLVLQ